MASYNCDSSTQLVTEIVKILDENKAQDVNTIDLYGKSGIFDYMVVVSGTSGRHIHSLAEKLSIFLKQNKRIKVSIEGGNNSEWLLIDAIDVVIHIFKPEVRNFYNIESLWDSDLQSPTLASG